jgi:serine/threonine protein kinase
MHSKGWANRDVKLENIFLRWDKENGRLSPIAYLGDFGTAKHKKRSEKFRGIASSPGYEPPEMIKDMHNSEYTEAIDCWGMGVVIYALATCEWPFSDPIAEREHYVREVLNGEVYEPLLEKVDEALRDLIMGLLTVNVDERLTADTALKHDFFTGIDGQTKNTVGNLLRPEDVDMEGIDGGYGF